MVNRQSISRWLIAIAVATASIPFSLAFVDYHFTLASLLIVPAFAAGVWLTVSATAERRAWWFGYAFTVGACLPLCPTADQWLHAGARYIQRLSQRGVITLSQRVIEPALIVADVFGPPVVASLLGVFVGTCLQRLAQQRGPLSIELGKGHWRFSLRELLFAFAAIGFLLAWIVGHTRHWQNSEHTRQLAFLERFTMSFSSGRTELLGEPHIEELQRTRMSEFGSFVFRAPGVNEYRIVANIKIDDNEVCAVWSYTCNEDAGEMIHRYAYAQAPTYAQLPAFPFPAQRRIETTFGMIDGIPVTAGATATVLSATSPARAGQRFTLTATALAGTTCNVHFFPRGSLPEGAAQSPDKSGNISWSWDVQESLAGYGVNFEIECTEMRGVSELRSTTKGFIKFAGSRYED